jgi:hypothetical protein
VSCVVWRVSCGVWRVSCGVCRVSCPCAGSFDDVGMVGFIHVCLLTLGLCVADAKTPYEGY